MLPPETSDAAVFDRRAVRRHRERAAPRLAAHDFLFVAAAAELADRLAGINRRFACALDLGARAGVLRQALAGRDRVGVLIEAAPTAALARRAAAGPALAADEEFLPFADESLDLVLSCLALHWVNDLPGALIQVRRALRPDGLFLAALLGGDTLHELRAVLLQAEAEVLGGASPRLSPTVPVAAASALLLRAGFALPVADIDRLTVTYPDALALMRELRHMGETNAACGRRSRFTPRTVLARAAVLYRELYGLADGRVPATFEVIYLTGWAPHASQQRPLRPGSATTRLADALGTTEHAAGDKARPR